MAANETIGYKDVNPFYYHITWLMEEEARAKWKYNDIGAQINADPLKQQLIHLEDWFMTLETLFHRIIGKLDKEEVEEVEAIVKKIMDITRGDNFSTSGLGTEDIINIRNHCRNMSKLLNILLWRHKIHVDVKPTKVPGMIW